MKAEEILYANELDIVFDGRHKQYGAYMLRRFYKRRLLLAITFVFIVAAVLSLAGLFYKPTVMAKKADIITMWGHVAPELEKPKEKTVEPKKPETPQKPKQEMARSEKFIANIRLVDHSQRSDKLPVDLDSAIIDDHQSDGIETSSLKVKIPQGPPGTGDGGIHKGPVDDPVSSKPLDVAEVMPSYPGGIDALRKFLERNLRSPQSLDPGGDVTVKMKFVVGINGELQSFETVQDGGMAFNKEVLRVLKKMPSWIPGKSRGENVSVYYILPVTFAAQD